MEFKNKVKIKISEKAYDELIKMLLGNDEYSYVKFSSPGSCANCGKVEIYLDNYNENNYVADKIDKLPIMYSKDLHKNIEEIDLIYKNSSFMLKTIKCKNIEVTSCNSSCKSCGKCNKSPL